MRKVALIFMLLTASLAFGLETDVAKRALTQEQTKAIQYQEQIVTNQTVIQTMNDDQKFADFQKRLGNLRRQIFIRQFEFDKKFTTVDERSQLKSEIDPLVDEHSKLLHEFELFVNSLK
jgi:predicted  nucleic acid-binding Zn-ribbon protein